MSPETSFFHMNARKNQTWQEVEARLRLDVVEGAYAPGEMMPSEASLAISLGTSRGTIRKAIESLIESGLLTRQPFSRPVVASPPADFSDARDVYVWLCRPISNEIALQIVKGVSRGLAGTRYRMVVREPSRLDGSVVSAEERSFLLDLLNNPDVAGAIVERDPFANDDDVMAKLSDQKHIVLIDCPPPAGVNADFVGTANVVAARQCVEHLIDLGHVHIACIMDTDIPEPAADRVRGYWRAMRQAGLESFGKVVVAADLPESLETERVLAGQFARALKKNSLFPGWPMRAVQAILAMDPRPTALFVGHDAMAHWVCSLLEGRGLQIPEDISVVGFDWLARYDQLIPDLLTTAAQDFEGFGWHAANLLLDHLSSKTELRSRHILLNAPLVKRSSTDLDIILPPFGAVESSRAKEPI